MGEYVSVISITAKHKKIFLTTKDITYGKIETVKTRECTWIW